MFDFLPADRPYVIAEAGGNHGGEVEVAKDYIRAASQTGADAIKFQFYRGERLINESEPPLPQVSDDYDSQRERFTDLELEREEWESCVDLADECGIDFLASAFDQEMATFAAEVGPFVKIASGDLTFHSLLDHVADMNCPVVLSTGCATSDEIDQAVDRLSRDRLALLHCVSSYPTPDEHANLHLIDWLRERYELPVGYSDHTTDTTAAIGAAATGARIIEVHFTLGGEGGDHALSATPQDMERIVSETARMATLRGDSSRQSVIECEDNCGQLRRSLATARALDAGEQLTRADLTALRPERGIPAAELDDVLGRTVTRDIPELTIIERNDLD